MRRDETVQPTADAALTGWNFDLHTTLPEDMIRDLVLMKLHSVGLQIGRAHV